MMVVTTAGCIRLIVWVPRPACENNGTLLNGSDVYDRSRLPLLRFARAGSSRELACLAIRRDEFHILSQLRGALGDRSRIRIPDCPVCQLRVCLCAPGFAVGV